MVLWTYLNKMKVIQKKLVILKIHLKKIKLRINDIYVYDKIEFFKN